MQAAAGVNKGVEAAGIPIDADVIHVYTAALILRQALLSVKNTEPFPPMPSELSEDKIQVPPAIYNFLSWLISVDNSDAAICLESCVVSPSQGMHRWILSVGQDLIFNATQGQMKTPKHVSVPIAIKQLTGSTQTVTLLNRFGHCISETQLRE